MQKRAINFVLLNPEVITKNKNINSRAMTMFFKSIETITDYSKNENLALIRMLGNASVGDQVSQMFVTFINNKLDRLITPKKMMTGDKDEVFREIKSCVGDQNGNYRSDIASVLATRILNWTTEYVANGGKVDDKINTRIVDLISSDSFTNDLKFFLSVKVFAIDNNKFAKMLMNPTVRQYITKQ